MTNKLSIQMARNVMLAAQGLDRPRDQPATKADVLEVIRRMGLLQIDTIHVVARSPYLVLWSRLGDYRPAWLDELLTEGALFEYWAHAMCFIPIEEYALYRRHMLDGIENKVWEYQWAAKWAQEHTKVMKKVRTHLQKNGAVRSAEFETNRHVLGRWWNRKEEKDALEIMFLTGEVMIARRQNFQRVYDLRERILPDWEADALPSSEELQRTLALRAVRALGIAFPAWVPDYFRVPKTGMPKRLEALAQEGLLLQVEVKGLGGHAYVHPDRIHLIAGALSGNLEPTLTTLLSPFDPLVWDRDRALTLFDFNYKIECYTPASKRRYGYFTLPILHRGKLIGRLDPKAHRAQGVFEIKALHMEPGVRVTQRLLTDLAAALHRLAEWHGTPDIVIRQSDPTRVTALLKAAL
ncbi:MAG TPA: crosslink repair DNA glycosylase YcaQ family protein [Anaerolineales bacterium]|nr:crosslink repair DNA glycosylase YcaQ family protein [Anaerolineales bacterium]